MSRSKGHGRESLQSAVSITFTGKSSGGTDNQRFRDTAVDISAIEAHVTPAIVEQVQRLVQRVSDAWPADQGEATKQTSMQLFVCLSALVCRMKLHQQPSLITADVQR